MTDRVFKRERLESDTERKSDFPCPVCASRDTISYTPQDVIHNNRINKNIEWPVVYASGMMPNYIRYRKCVDCEAKWQTCESIVINSIVDESGDVVG